MAYTTATLSLVVMQIGSPVTQKWVYASADALATLTGAGYVTDAHTKGMIVGDLIEVVNPTGPKYVLLQCTAVSATTGAVTLAMASTLYNGTVVIGNNNSLGSGTAANSLVLNNGNIGNISAPTSKLHITGLQVFANNAAAIAGGLTAGAFYRTGADPDTVCVVH